MKYLNYLILLSALLLLQSCEEDNLVPFELNKVSSYKSDVAIDWINLQRNLVKSTAGFTPPVAARSYAYAALALYESVVPGIRGNISYSGLIIGYTGQGIPSLEKDKNYNWEIVANASMAYMLRNQFKTTSIANLDLINQMEQNYLSKNSSDDTTLINRSVTFGKTVADVIYNFSKTDNQDEAYKTNFPDYTIPNDPWKWEPTSPSNPKPLQPFWGSVRTFLAVNAVDVLIQSFPPLTYSVDSKSLFYLQAFETYITSINLNDEQTTIAKFWSDDPGLTSTPPGHSMSIAGQAIKNENKDLAFAAEVYSKVGMAVHDAFVCCWKAKYIYNLVRPVTYIKKYIDANYSTLLNTPPFPEHTSGHSVQTSASMAVLESFFGYNYAITDHTNDDRTDITLAPRSFNSFAGITNEAAISRLYGGIHYRQAIEGGKFQGALIGNNIASLSLKN